VRECVNEPSSSSTADVVVVNFKNILKFNTTISSCIRHRTTVHNPPRSSMHVYLFIFLKKFISIPQSTHITCLRSLSLSLVAACVTIECKTQLICAYLTIPSSLFFLFMPPSCACVCVCAHVYLSHYRLLPLSLRSVSCWHALFSDSLSSFSSSSSSTLTQSSVHTQCIWKRKEFQTRVEPYAPYVIIITYMDFLYCPYRTKNSKLKKN
jgi:hypothetical protein